MLPPIAQVPPTPIRTAQPGASTPLLNPNSLTASRAPAAQPNQPPVPVFIDTKDPVAVRSAFDSKNWLGFDKEAEAVIDYSKIDPNAQRLMRALALQETGRWDRSTGQIKRAARQYDVGDRDKLDHAYGPFQIRMPFLIDANEFSGRMPRVVWRDDAAGRAALKKLGINNKKQWYDYRANLVRTGDRTIKEYDLFTDPNASWPVVEALLKKSGWDGKTPINTNKDYFKKFIWNWNQTPKFHREFPESWERSGRK